MTFEVAFDTDELDEDSFLRIVKRAEKFGLGDYRPEFGAFQSSTSFLREQKASVQANGAKKRDEKVVATVKKLHEKITAGV